MGAGFCPSVQTGPGFQPASYTMGTASFPGAKLPLSGVDQPSPSSAEFKDGVELYVLSALWIFMAFSMVKFTFVQGGAETTDIFQMVIDDIWKQEKISETVCKYVQLCYLLPTDYKLIF